MALEQRFPWFRRRVGRRALSSLPVVPRALRSVANAAVASTCFASSVLSQGGQPAAAAVPPQGVAAFVDVTVIPMDRDRVLDRHTVVVRDGRIAAIGPVASTRVPTGAIRVDGRGKFLMPGLAEMHAHIPGGNAPEQLVRDIMLLYIANGVTTIRGMLGAPTQLILREQTARAVAAIVS
jgi:hypothetical protein